MQALILAGGSGTRFWPLSRRLRPKQLLALDGERSLLRATVDRLAPLVPAEAIWVCTTRLLAGEVRRQLPGVPAAQVLCEPAGRDTAAAIGWSVSRLPPEKRGEVVAVLPADHRVADDAAFRDVLARAAAAAEGERVMTLGVTPNRPETGYGYLELAEPLDPAGGLRRVARFTEKPDAETARRFAASGEYLWNAGIFLFRGTVLLELLARHQPELAAGLETLAAEPHRLDEIYPRLPATSIDYGLMEKLDDIATLPLDCGWSDLGSWSALADVLATDGDGNVTRGDVLALDARDNLLFADAGTVAVVGVEGLVVVRTGDTVLVVPKDLAQEVRRVVDALAADGREDLL